MFYVRSDISISNKQGISFMAKMRNYGFIKKLMLPLSLESKILGFFRVSWAQN